EPDGAAAGRAAGRQCAPERVRGDDAARDASASEGRGTPRDTRQRAGRAARRWVSPPGRGRGRRALSAAALAHVPGPALHVAAVLTAPRLAPAPAHDALRQLLPLSPGA